MFKWKTTAHLHTHMCVSLGSSPSFKHVWLNNKDILGVYNFIIIISSFLISILVSVGSGIIIIIYIYIYIYICVCVLYKCSLCILYMGIFDCVMVCKID